MIKIENAVFPSDSQWKSVILGARNPLNSWDKYDSFDISKKLGDNDLNLLMKLVKAGTDHGKFMRMLPVFVDITAPLYWFKEFDTYKVGTVANSCSTMHKIASKEFTWDDFSMEHLYSRYDVQTEDIEYASKSVLRVTIDALNHWREKYLKTKNKDDWWQMIQLLPSTYNQKRTVMLNYEVLANMYCARKSHKLDEWREFCRWIKKEVPFSSLITKEKNESDNE